MPSSLADVIFWIAVACCVVAQWFILRGALTAPATPAAGDAVPAARRPAEIAWAIVPALVLALVLAATWRAMHPANPRATNTTPEHTVARGREVLAV